MATRIGTITGIALVPGVSRNGRLYTAEAIGRACARATARIEEGGAPLTMLTHHAADDDSTRIVGRLTSLVQLDDGRARYTADLADTDDARTIATLVDGTDGPPYLDGVSIRGAWVGRVRRQPGPDGVQVETADDLEIDGLDFTRKPGVPGARVDSFTREAASAPAETAPESRVLITESVQEALVTTTTEADTPAVSKRSSGLTGDGVKYADPGYQADKKQRYDISSKAKAKAAWSYINQADNARAYTSAQLKRIKQRIVKALKSFGVQVATQEGWLIEPAAQVTEALAECWGMDAADAGNLYLSLTNGPTTVTVSSHSLDPHDLDAVGRAAMNGACQALACIDPDMDADVDVPGQPDDDAEPASAAGAPCPCGCGCATPETPGGCPCGCESCTYCKGEQDEDDSDGGAAMETAPETPAPETPAAEITQEKEPAMAESTTPAAETPGTDSVADLSAKFDKLTDLIGGLVTAIAPKPAATESAPAESVAETQAAAPAAEVTETDEQRIARLVAEGVAAALPKAIQEHVETTGGPARKGLVAQVAEAAGASGAGSAGLPEGWPQKPLHQYTDEEWRTHVAPSTVGAILGARGAIPAE